MALLPDWQRRHPLSAIILYLSLQGLLSSSSQSFIQWYFSDYIINCSNTVFISVYSATVFQRLLPLCNSDFFTTLINCILSISSSWAWITTSTYWHFKAIVTYWSTIYSAKSIDVNFSISLWVLYCILPLWRFHFKAPATNSFLFCCLMVSSSLGRFCSKSSSLPFGKT